jgi:hypothetical protein
MELKEIEKCIADHFGTRENLIVCRVSWGLLNHEADVIVMSKSGYCTEIEIKRSWADFLADFKKDHRHEDERIKEFYYCVSEEMQDRVVDYLHHNQVDAGLFVYSQKAGLIRLFGDSRCWKRGINNAPSRKLFLEEQYQLARLGALKYWKS